MMRVYTQAGWWDIGRVCVFVCVCLYRLCVRSWVCVPLPLVFLLSKTLTSSEKGTYYLQPIIIQNYFKSLSKRAYSVLIIVAVSSNINVIRIQKNSTTLKRWVFSYSPLPSCCHIWVSLPPSPYQGSSAWASGPLKQVGVLWPSSRTWADSYSDAGFQTFTCRGRTVRDTKGLRHVLHFGYTNALSLLCKRKEKQAQQRGCFLYLSAL